LLPCSSYLPSQISSAIVGNYGWGKKDIYSTAHTLKCEKTSDLNAFFVDKKFICVFPSPKRQEELVSGRMDWDRVRKENLSMRKGSEWVDPEPPPATNPGENRENSKQKSTNALSGPIGKAIYVPPSLKGCRCGKRVGFIGAHKKRCPLSAKLRTAR